MSQTSPTTSTFREFLKTLRKQFFVWFVPSAIVSLLALGYAFVHRPTWQASQALLVRDEAGGNLKRAGRFADADAMKTAQETILEIAKNHALVSAALAQVGPPTDHQPPTVWPSPYDIEKGRRAISVSAPKGAEFGRTEVIYLIVEQGTRSRSIALAKAVCDQLEKRLQELRHSKAESIIAELVKTMNLARADLEEATQRLETMETEVGSDLGELRVLNEMASGDSNLRVALNQIKNELRQAKSRHDEIEQQLKLLQLAQRDTGELVATPNRLLESQPALRRLKDGLVDAQLHTAQLSGTMSLHHPRVQAAIAAEELVRRDLHNELEIAIRGLAGELKVSATQVESLETQLADVTGRLDRLAGMRARYNNLVAIVRQHTEIVDKAQKELADARASQAAALSTSLITRLDGPQAGNQPIGPGRLTIVLCGIAGGLIIGLAVVLMATPLGTLHRRRWTDYLNMSRRATDFVVGRRSTDRQLPQTAAAPLRRAEDFPAETSPHCPDQPRQDWQAAESPLPGIDRRCTTGRSSSQRSFDPEDRRCQSAERSPRVSATTPLTLAQSLGRLEMKTATTEV